jgi:hypothetical protein
VVRQLQEAVIEEQVRACLAQRVACPDCGRCRCRPHARRTFTPLAEVLPEHTTPELLSLESKFAGLVSYGLSTRLLSEVLPLGRPLHATTVRRQVQATAQRLEDELGPEQAMFFDAPSVSGRNCRGRTCR